MTTFLASVTGKILIRDSKVKGKLFMWFVWFFFFSWFWQGKVASYPS